MNNFDLYEEIPSDILSKTIRQSDSIESIKHFLEQRANTGTIDVNGRTPLANAIFENRPDIASLLLEFGAISTIEQQHSFTLFSTLDQAIVHSGLNMVKLLLENGADSYIQSEPDMVIEEVGDFIEYIWTDNDFSKKAKYTKEEYKKVENLFKNKTPPYIKAGEIKYIIYENKIINNNIVVYLLTDKKPSDDSKKYLYQDNKIDLFVYWCFQNGLLIDSVIDVMTNYINTMDDINYKNIESFQVSTIGDKLTTDYFTERGKLFSTSYLTVTHWWHSLHIDFNKLYAENNKSPHAIKSQEEFNALFKLLDIRLAQFESGKRLNPNQSKEEIEFLIAN